MSRRGRERPSKRQLELDRAERAAAKAARKEAAAANREPDEGDREADLLDEFRLLNERHAAGEIADTTFAARRREILDALGVEED